MQNAECRTLPFPVAVNELLNFTQQVVHIRGGATGTLYSIFGLMFLKALWKSLTNIKTTRQKKKNHSVSREIQIDLKMS
jgi:hypothetical protein